jgi:hypothetical protein
MVAQGSLSKIDIHFEFRAQYGRCGGFITKVILFWLLMEEGGGVMPLGEFCPSARGGER